jgi:hypothetical protein
VSVNFPIAVPFTDTRPTRPVETDNVPALGDGGTDEGLAADVAGLVPVPAGVDAPGDRSATGVVVTPAAPADGTSPYPGRAGPGPWPWRRGTYPAPHRQHRLARAAWSGSTSTAASRTGRTLRRARRGHQPRWRRQPHGPPCGTTVVRLLIRVSRNAASDRGGGTTSRYRRGYGPLSSPGGPWQCRIWSCPCSMPWWCRPGGPCRASRCPGLDKLVQGLPCRARMLLAG